MKKLSIVDKGFLMGETPEMPMHVGGVSLFTLPEGSDEQEFLHGLADNLRGKEPLLPPFGDHLKLGRAGLAGDVYWEPDDQMEMDYHVRHSALPKPGRYRELFTLVSRLHASHLDRQRPLWELHLIEGLQNRQFAIYTKTHHAAIDGARSVHLSRSMLSADPDHRLIDSPFSLASWERYKASLNKGHKRTHSDEAIRNVADRLKASFNSGVNIFHAVKGFTKAWTGLDNHLSMPHLKVPKTVFNGSISSSRRFVAQSWPFARIRQMGKAFDGTFNDAVLAMCSGAVRKYLINHSELPDASLKTLVPVSLRSTEDLDAGNAVAAISVDLATHLADPAQRFKEIQASVVAGKDYYKGMSPTEVELYSMIIQTPAMALLPLGLISKLPPYNLTISNVPGIQETMYWNGARMNGSYPMSIVTDGMAMNITLLTYDQNVDFGIIACRRSLPQIQRMIDYMEESLQELEDAAGLGAKPTTKRKSAPKKARKSATTAKKRPKVKRKAVAKKES